MRVSMRVFSLPKAGNEPDENEDAAWPDRSIDVSAGAFRAAVADGATESYSSGLWARMLVRAFCRRAQRLSSLRVQWLNLVNHRALPWYAEEKLRMGAFAALVGLSLDQTGPWTASAVGDSCLFQVRDTELLRAFPLDCSEQFGVRPVLIPSNPEYANGLTENQSTARGEWRPGDRFLLMTDALACWFLKETESGIRPWNDLPDSSQFEEFVQSRRTAGKLRNDDVTLLTLRVE